MKKRVLILDNKIAIVEIIKEVMRSEGYHAKGMHLTDHFIPVVHCYKPDLIIIDYNLLSRFNGEEFCQQIKSDPKTAHIAVIIISTYPRLLHPFNHHGPDAWMYKPFSLKEVTECVRDLFFHNRNTPEAAIEHMG